ncbi:MAG: T9SS type A sorting domain-containing protein, partial [Bacteroidota bacterium]
AYQAGLIQGSAYYVWDAEAGTTGAYIVQPITAPTDYYDLPSAGAFVVNAATNGNLTFHESDKIAKGDYLFRTTNAGPVNRVEFRVYSNNDSIYWDRFFVSFNDQANNGIDNFDGSKASNPNVNFYSIAPDSTQLSIDARPFVNNTVIPLGFKTTMPAQQYKIKVQTYALASDHIMYLVDNYLNTVQPMQLGSEYTFDVTSDPLSQGNDRFQLNGAIVTSTTAVNNTPAQLSSTLKVAIAPNPAVDMTSISFEGADANSATSVVINNINGQDVYSVNVKASNTGKVNVPLQNLAAGIYMVTISNGANTITERLVKQ